MEKKNQLNASIHDSEKAFEDVFCEQVCIHCSVPEDEKDCSACEIYRDYVVATINALCSVCH